MKPASFEYHRPASIGEALTLLAEYGAQAKLISGGQSLIPMMNMRLASPAHLIDINDLSELAGVKDRGDLIEIGTLTRHHEVASSSLTAVHCPLVSQAASTIGHYAIRQRGTLGGSLAHADPAAQMALVACTLDARITLARHSGERELASADFFEGAMTTAVRPDEMIVRVGFPKQQPGERSSFKLFSRRHGDFAVIAVAMVLGMKDGKVNKLHIGVGGASPVPVRLDAALEDFLDKTPDAPWVVSVGLAAYHAIAPEESTRIPAIYRKELTQSLVMHALNDLLAEQGMEAA
ncbi:FAD binding domain-containing protein [Ottowia thiooxydans]|uniref:FAD binding domain-containing protein n=1 Tax=Ottowia thiooxydans TaxID=219182 RepID=UPI0004045767|nr:xanthine dehydrogenase family protein subunit M [Ottowia thiooxydans]